ncbi:hypothetical protein [Candidatus Sulfurimonas baltica]|uniref:Indole-3-glycerol-phosphate synthase n=1 Tax=Candidatus Sulfurimonas baltica TaxID=2740404 RepID=A0A7S7LUQ9_9BACT|nr:hypothetical protein [Candidatus Sulfurimonas baltica]QOY51655.1 hypothetical protein HUE88_11160 [Candidatus Sulfurimonas baltica]
MLFFGHRFIDSENFYHIPNIDAIKNTPPSSTIYVEFSEDNLDIIKHAIKNSVNIAVEVIDITQVVYASALGVSFIIVSKKLAKTAQNLAENYLFDAKILVYIEDEDEIEELAILGVDGIICSNAIIKINS